jgi:tetratricopeptide (TPR) repeat protein
VQRLAQEHDNLRAALHWFLEQGEDREEALRMGSALHVFWVTRGSLLEGRTFLGQALAQSRGAASAVRMKALMVALVIALMAGDLPRCEELCQEFLSQCREQGDPFGTGLSLFVLGCLKRYRADFVAARSLFEESLDLAKQSGYKPGIFSSLLFLAYVAYDQGDDTRVGLLCEQCLAFSGERNAPGVAWPFLLSRLAELHFVALGDSTTGRALLEESLAICQERNDMVGKADCYRIVAQRTLQQGDITTARALAEISVKLSYESGHRPVTARTLALLGKVMAASGDIAGAAALYQRSLSLAQELDYQGRSAFGIEGPMSVVVTQGEAAWAARFGIEGLASIAAQQGEVAWAVRLWGLASALPTAMALSLSISPRERAEYERLVAAARARLGEQAFAAAWDEGGVHNDIGASAGMARAGLPL